MAAVPLIAVRDLEKTYAMDGPPVHALCGVTLAIQRGEFVAVVGPSGSGKSTLMHILGCLDRPTSGTYHLDGRTSIEIMEIFQRLNAQRGITIVLITHEPQVAAYASRIIQIIDGRLVTDLANASHRAAAAELAGGGHG